MTETTCAVAGCDISSYCKGFCEPHYRRFKKYGDPLGRNPGRVYGDYNDEQRLLTYGWDITNDGCWEIKSSRTIHGYGRVRNSSNKQEITSRMAYRVWVGPIPDGMLVLHSCDNPPCINPEHLRIGTHFENSMDRSYRGRTGSRLSREDVIEIRRRLDNGETLVELGADYGVHFATISAIKTGITWKWLQ